jgi:hypothetical protein
MCNNLANAHNPIVISEDDNVVRVICSECKQQEVIRKDWRGVPENRQYSKFFKRWILQGNDNLFYKYHDEYIRH